MELVKVRIFFIFFFKFKLDKVRFPRFKEIFLIGFLFFSLSYFFFVFLFYIKRVRIEKELFTIAVG